MNIEIQPQDSILVVAPHADDESIGCGGLLSIYGKQTDLLLLTDGRKGHADKNYEDENVLAQIREKEFKEAADLANASSVFFLRIEDGRLCENKNSVYSFDIKKYDYIFIPNRYESHIDHKTVFPIFRKMKKSQRSHAKLMEYEVWTPLRHPTWFLDITSYIENKQAMIEKHKTQLKDINYVEKGIALSCYRGVFIGVKYAEAFTDFRYSGFMGKIYDLIPTKFKEKVKKFL